MGLEPTASWATTRCSNQLSYAHHMAYFIIEKAGKITGFPYATQDVKSFKGLILYYYNTK
jgi:hypothetical protein|tara:strand:+ start:1707 stop:1886 length:180 start_codon:yes stop_codon:yes gene_type:complete